MHAITRTAAAAVVGAALTGASHGGDCAPPVNEECEGAIVFGTHDLPLIHENLLGCDNDVADKPYWDVFFRYDCTTDGAHTFDMCESERDTYLRIYVDGCGFSEGSELAVADDECPSSPPNADPQITIELEAGTTYWIELGTFRPDKPWGAPNIPYTFRVSLDPDTCDGDVTGDAVVDAADLVALLAAWGPCAECPEDVDGNGVVDTADLLVLLAAWGPCP
jgi:hypothetical protein